MNLDGLTKCAVCEGLTKCAVCEGLVVPGSQCPSGIECPTCGAGPRERCKRPSGHRGNFINMHRERYVAAEAIDREKGIEYPTS